MLFFAITGDVAKIKALHTQGLIGAGEEACIIAAANGQLDVVKYLHRSGCDIQNICAIALPLAAANGRLEIVRYFHTKGCDIAAPSNKIMLAAARKNKLDIVKYLHRNGASIEPCGSIAPALATSSANKDLVEYLVASGVSPRGLAVMKFVNAVRAHDFTLAERLMGDSDVAANAAHIIKVVAETGDPRLMQNVHQHGCDIHVEDELAFRIAAAHGHVALLKYLNGNGTNIHANDDEALKLAAENGHLEAVIWLCQWGADILKIDEESQALIQLNGHATVFNYLTDSGLDAISSHRSAIAAMREELYSAKPIYRPSKLWEFFNEINMEQLRRGAIGNFKRTINQNYFNFIPYILRDPQFLNLIQWWIAHPTLTPFKLKMIDPDIAADRNTLLYIDRRIFNVARQYPRLSTIARRFQLVVYRWIVAMLWDFIAIKDQLGLVQKLTEPRLGSPIEVYYGDRLISQDLAHSILECNAILGEIDQRVSGRPLRIAEIGAGYGRLGYVLLEATQYQYAVFDIPPSLYVSQWYLSEMFPRKRVFRFRPFEHFEQIADELAQADIAFFTANQIELIPEGYFDISVNISSLHELRPDQIESMLLQIYRITANFIYLKQYKEYINPYDELRILEDSYKVAPGWKHRYYRNDPVDPRFFETLLEKTPISPPHDNPMASPRTHEGAIHLAANTSTVPSVSLLLANYNHAEYLPTSLAAICGQTHPATEIIIVDDGSTDNSVAEIEKYAARYPNIRLLKNGMNRGQHHSIQRALLAARGEYVVWAASDDLLLPQFLERSLDMLRQYPEAGLCFSRLAVFVDGTTEVRHYDGRIHGVAFDYGTSPHYMSPQQLAAALHKRYIWMSGNTVVARRAALLEMGGFEHSLRWHADWFAYYTVALRYGACVIPETLALMRERLDTYSRDGIANPTLQSEVLKSIFDKIKAPKYRDVLRVFQRCPSLLSLFGKKALFIALRNPRHWDLGLQLAFWHGPRFIRNRYGRFRHRLASVIHNGRALKLWR